MTDTQARIDAGMALLRQRFLERLPGRLEEIRSALASGGQPADANPHHPAARLAHSLAGAAGTFGFDALAGAARQLDTVLRDPGNTPAAHAEALAVLAVEADAVRLIGGN